MLNSADEWAIVDKETVNIDKDIGHGWLIQYPERVVSSYTAAELGAQLPKHFYCEGRRYAIQYGWDGSRWRIRLEEWLPCGNCKEDSEIFTDENEANIRAEMLIYLIENNLIELLKRNHNLA